MNTPVTEAMVEELNKPINGEDRLRLLAAGLNDFGFDGDDASYCVERIDALTAALAHLPAGSEAVKPGAKDAQFLLDVADYFERRPTNGEDRAVWANTYNAENCRRIAAMLAALGGALGTPVRVVAPGIGTAMIIQAFVITVIGGLGNLKGAFVGALIVGILTSFGILLFPVFELFIIFVVMAIVLMVKPEGLFGK